VSFSYSPDMDTDKDKVRFFVGDTVSGSGSRPNGVNLTDEEIEALLDLSGSWQGAAALACRALSAAWVNEANSIKIGTYSATYTDRAKMYSAKAEELEGGMVSSMAGLFGHTDTGHMFGKRQWGANPTDWASR
jgi:hypothetical protein